MLMVRSGEKVVCAAWQMAFLIEVRGRGILRASRRVNRKKTHIAKDAYKQYLKFRRFAELGYTEADVDTGKKNHRKGASCER